MNKRKYLIFPLLAMLLCAMTAMAAPSIKIKLVADNPHKIKVGEKFNIDFTVEGIGGVGQSQVPGAQVSFFHSSVVNGVGRGSYTLHAMVPGKYSFSMQSGGVKSNTISYTIVDSDGKAPATAPQRQNDNTGNGGNSDADNSGPKYIGKGDGNLFMRASVSKTKAYNQEALVYTVKLYSTYSTIKFIGATTSPKFEGFVVEESKATDSQLHFENYNGKEYATAVIARYIIFPQMTGIQKVIGNTYTVSVEERYTYRDSYFGNMSYGRPIQLNVTPNDLSVEVLPLPQPQPADFSGGVGKFTLSSSIETTHLKTNLPTSLKYEVSGSGNLRYIKLPEPQTFFPSQLEVFSPQTDVKSTVDATNVKGTVTFDYSLMPIQEGDFVIPEMRLVYFNPETGKYETSTAHSYDITVGKGTASAKSHKREELTMDMELMQGGIPHFEHINVVHRFWYWLFYIVPTLILAFALIFYRRYSKLREDIDTLKSIRANKLAKKWLGKARKDMLKNDRKDFNNSILNALWGYLGDKMKIKPSELNRKNVTEVLENYGLHKTGIHHLIQLIDEVEFSKYSSLEATSSMQDQLNTATELLGELEDCFSKASKAREAKEEEGDEEVSDNQQDITGHNNTTEKNEK